LSHPSLFVIRHRLTSRYSPVAIHCRFGSAEVSPLVCPPTEVGGYKNEARLKQAEKPKGASPDAPKKFFFRQRRSAALQKILVSPIAIRHSLFATRRRFAIRCRFPTCRFADLPISRFADKIRLGRRLALPQ
jgi:hypothetical protein